MKRKNEKGETVIVLEDVHYRLYDALTDSAEKDAKMSLKDVCEAIGVPYDEPKQNQYVANTKAYRRIWNIKEEINLSGYFDKTVVIKGNDYRFATKEELLAYDKELEDQIKNLGKRRKMLKVKRLRDKQGKFLNNAGNPINPSNKQCYESFRKARKEG